MKFSQEILDRISDITIENGDVVYHAHKIILAGMSGFFRKACNGNWKESVQNKITLNNDDPEIFEKVMKFIYDNTYHGGFAASVDFDSQDISLLEFGY